MLRGDYWQRIRGETRLARQSNAGLRFEGVFGGLEVSRGHKEVWSVKSFGSVGRRSVHSKAETE
jgi:hypothetical protein